ncbi:hypothetical protein BX616_003370 [Lobosporangium transversale]|nr:hypothetical protein BX616_003370 [Lobosporangium transversale]
MKFSILATIAAMALAVSTDAYSKVSLHTGDDLGGSCRNFEITKYDQCINVSDFKNARSAAYYHDDPHAKEITLTFYESKNCGGKWTRSGFKSRVGTRYSWGKLQNVYGKVGSVVLHKGRFPSGNGVIKQHLPSKSANFKKCK